MKPFYLKLLSMLMLIVMVIGSGAMVATAAPAVAPLAASGAWVSQTYVQGPPDNALKGFMPYQGSYSTFPYSMEWNYVAWSDIQTGPTTYNWAPIDNLLNDVASRGHQTVFRVYADYPGRPYAVPGFLSGVAKNAYTDYGNSTSFSPNYDDPSLLSAMTNLIGAMGARYDGDPRIGFITVGFIGFWGEWHTYRPSCACDTWMPTVATQNTVLSAFDNAFNKTKILLRYPMGNSPSMNMGYHDDSFNYATYGATTWYFWPKIIAAGVQNKWQTEPIGGEMYPDIQLTTWNSSSLCVTGGAGDQQCFNSSVDTTHASWMIAHQLFSPGNSGTAHSYALAGAQRMGYDLFVSAVALPDTTTSGNLQVSIRMQDKGVAPFYYPWKVQLGVANSANSVVATWDTTWDLTTVKDATDHQFDFTKSGHGLAAGSYKLLMRAVNPLSNGKPLVFANQKWGQDVANWLTLDTFTVSSGGGATATRTNTPVGPTATWTATSVGGVTSYEAEASGNTLAGGAAVAACAPCSGGNKVGFVGNNSGTLQFNGLSAGSAGNYTLTIYYANGDTVARSATISVNGGAGTNLSFPVTGSWTTVGSLQTTISLNAGSGNTLKFSNASGWAPDFDRITLNTGGSPTNTPTRTNTPVGPTATRTNTPVGPTATRTNTPAVPTATSTSGSSLLLDNFDGTPAWFNGTANDLGKWTGANGFANGGGAGVESGGALALQYNNAGWFGSDVLQDVSGKTYLVFVVKGAAGGEQNAFHVILGGVDNTLGALSGDTITTSYKTIRINMATAGINRASPGQLQLTFWWGSSGTITIEEIRFE